jgi:excisionase family DNA binding protein
MTGKPERMSLKELAAHLGYDHTTIAALIEAGKGPGIKVGSRFLILTEWVERWQRGEPGFWSHGIAGTTPIEPTAPSHPFIRRTA